MKKRLISYLASLISLVLISVSFAGTEGLYNTLYGNNAGASITSPATSMLYNTFVGAEAGTNNTSGFDNTFIGMQAGVSNSTGDFNIFIGTASGYSNSTGYENLFIGTEAGYDNSTGSQNTFIGNWAGYSNFDGSINTIIGYEAGLSNVSGDGNVFIGYQAGYNETGSDRLYIENSNTNDPLIYGEFDNDIVGINGQLGVGTESPIATFDVRGTIYINAFTNGQGQPEARFLVDSYNSGGARREPVIHIDNGANWGLIIRSGTNSPKLGTYTGGSFDFYPYSKWRGDLDTSKGILTKFDFGNMRVGIKNESPAYELDVAGTVNASNGYSQVSDLKFKTAISSIESSLDKVQKMRGVPFMWKKEKFKDMGFSDGRHYGVIAQEIEKILPEIVQENSNGDKSVSYTEIIPILIEAVKELSERVKELEKEIVLRNKVASARSNIH